MRSVGARDRPQFAASGARRSWPALRASARVRQHGSSALSIELDLPEDLPVLSAAVEVAIFRITEEALTNVVRHARATYCRVSLDGAQDIMLSIQDDGVGLPDYHQPGAGASFDSRVSPGVGGHVPLRTPGRGGDAHYRTVAQDGDAG